MANESQMSLEDKAIQILAEQIVKAIKSSGNDSDKTYMSVVTNVNSDGTYVVRDKYGTERNVRSGLPNLKIGRGTTVWLKQPDGDLNKLHICGVNAGMTTTSAASGSVYGTPTYNNGNNNNIINVDLSNYYTKNQIDNFLINISSSVTSEIFQELEKYYTKSEAEYLIGQMETIIVNKVNDILADFKFQEIIATKDEILNIFK